jgi:hypothetical protein
MADQVGDCAKNFQSFRPVIYVWHLPRYVPMMNGVAVGPRSCSTDLPAKVHSMGTQSEIFYSQLSGIAMKIQSQG